MKFLNDLLDVLKQYGPVLGVLLIAYYRDRAVDQKNKVRVAELEAKLLRNKANVDAENSGLDADAVIDKYTVPGDKPK